MLNTIFSCITSIFISFLYFGQYSGNFTRTVSSYTFVLVFPPQIGQWIQREFFRLSFTLYTSNNGIAPRWSSGFCLFIVYSKRANIRFCEWLVFPTYDNAFKQKIAYTGGRTWIIRILGNYSCIFHIGNCNFDNHRRDKTIWKNVGWDFTDVFGGKSFRYISAWRRNQRIFTCEFDLVIRICQYGNHVTQNVFSKEVWLYVICYFIDYLNFS